MKRHARIHVSTELLAQALHLPPGTEIEHAFIISDGVVELVVIHHALPENVVPPLMSVVCERVACHFAGSLRETKPL